MGNNLACFMLAVIVVGIGNLNCTMDAVNGLLTGVTLGMFIACVTLRAFR